MHVGHFKREVEDLFVLHNDVQVRAEMDGGYAYSSTHYNGNLNASVKGNNTFKSIYQ